MVYARAGIGVGLSGDVVPDRTAVGLAAAGGVGIELRFLPNLFLAPELYYRNTTSRPAGPRCGCRPSGCSSGSSTTEAGRGGPATCRARARTSRRRRQREAARPCASRIEPPDPAAVLVERLVAVPEHIEENGKEIERGDLRPRRVMANNNRPTEQGNDVPSSTYCGTERFATLYIAGHAINTQQLPEQPLYIGQLTHKIPLTPELLRCHKR